MAVLEAVSLGCKALVADTSGLSELAEQGLASSVPLDCPAEQVAAAALSQLRSPASPVDGMLKLPTWDDCAASLLALYDEIVRGSPST
jgi:hypothetical protein